MAIEGVHRSAWQGRVIRRISRPDRAVVEKLGAAYTGFILDHLGKSSYMRGLYPLYQGAVICGPAVTSLGPDLTVRRMAIDLSEPGDVLVVAAGGDGETACFGDGTARRMALKGMAGAVIDGATRDARFLRNMKFPTFCRGVTPKNYHYPSAPHHGGVNVPVICGNALVQPGDVIFGDDDGVVVIPRDAAIDLADTVTRNLLLERKARDAMRSYESYNVERELLDRGYTVE